MAVEIRNPPPNATVPEAIADFLKQVHEAQQIEAQQAAEKPLELAKPTNPTASTSPSAPPKEKSALDTCRRAYENAFQLARSKGEEEYHARKAAREAYRLTMPPLIGANNIRNFIACVAEGMILEAFPESEGTRLLYAAQIAHTAIEKPAPFFFGRPPSPMTKR